MLSLKIGKLFGPTDHFANLNLSFSCDAKSPDNSRWFSDKIFIANNSDFLKVVALNAVFAMQTNNNGGSRETEVNEFAVKPLGNPFLSFVDAALNLL